MKKSAIFIVSVLLLCGGLFCLHLTAQPQNASSSEPTPLLERKLDECSERELLELKVASRQKIRDNVILHSQVGSPRGKASRMAEVLADLAAAEIELYRHTGEQDKLLATHKARVEALTDKIRWLTISYQTESTTLEDIGEAEIQLLDALLEWNRDKTSPKN